MLLSRCYESLVISVRCLHEQVERALGLDTGEAVLGELSVEKLAVAVVDFYIHLRVLAASDRLLDQRRRVDKAEHAVCRRGARNDLIGIVKLVRQHQIADALAGQGQRLAVGVAHNCIVIVFRQIRHGDSVVHELAVRLVSDHVDARPVLLLLCAQHIRDLLDHFLGIHNASGVVRSVDDERLRLRRDHRGEHLRHRHKRVGISGGRHKHTVHVAHIVAVLTEERSEGNDLVAGVYKRLQDDVQTACSAYRHQYIFRGKCGPELLVQMLGDRGADILKARVVHISVEHVLVLVGNDVEKRLADLRRRNHARVAEAVVIDVLTAELLRHLRAFFKHCTDCGAVFVEIENHGIDHCENLLSLHP